jgi:pimeloyl-ACP methyl ester carboxylesterase
MVGEQDAAFLEAAEELAREIAGARRAVIPAAGHSPQDEAPEAWLAEIQKHLAEVRGGSSSST